MTHYPGNAASLPALRYREWRANRLLYGVVPILLVAPWALAVWAAMHPWSPLSAMELHGQIQRLMGTGDAFWAWDEVVAGLAAIAVFWRDRTRLIALLDGPVPRRGLLQAKGEFLLGSVLSGWILEVAVLVFAAGISGYRPWGALARYLALAGMAHLDIAVLSLVGAILAGNVVFACLGAGVLIFGPVALGGIVTVLGTAFWPGATAFSVVAHLLAHLSPVVDDFSPGQALAYLPVYAAVLAVMATLSFRWWGQAPVEAIASPLLFPGLWNGVYTLLAALSGLVTVDLIAAVIFRASLAPGPGLKETLAGYVLVGVGEWFLWRFVLRRILGGKVAV